MSDEKVYFLVAGSESTFPVDLTDIQKNFVRRLQKYFPTNPVQWVSLKEVREGLFKEVEKAKERFPGAAIVTLSSLYYPTAEFEISANRLVDVKKQRLPNLGPRPKAKPIRQQVEYLMSKACNRPIITVDDTLFHGDTLSTLMGMGMRVDAAVEYFSSLSAKEELESEGHLVFTVVGLEDYLDVMPIHDFLPPLPLCGKVVGFQCADECGPLIVDGISFSVPYLLPWITPVELCSWASIPESRAYDFSKFALEQSIDVMERLWSHGFSTLEQAVKYQPIRTSVPYLNGTKPNMKVSITIMLKECLHMVEQEEV